MPRVIIVGAGPGGGAAALALRQSGAAEVILVDRATYPRRKVCGSGLSPFALTQLSALGVLDDLRKDHIEMRRLRAVSPSGLQIRLNGSKGAWVVPRSELDHRIVTASARFGARLLEGTRVSGLLRTTDGAVRGVKTSEGELEADVVLVANGSPSNFEEDEQPREGIRTIMGWWQGRLPDGAGVMIWDRRLAGYYAWAFPEPRDVVNIGLTIPETIDRSRKLRSLFDEILQDHFRDVVQYGSQIGRWAGHPATVTTRVGKIAGTRSLFVGEAARLVCPATVEGISFALQSGRLAARAIQHGFDHRNGLSTLAQLRYKADVARSMIPKFLAGEALHRVMRSERWRRGFARIIDPRRMAASLAHFVGERSEAA